MLGFVRLWWFSQIEGKARVDSPSFHIGGVLFQRVYAGWSVVTQRLKQAITGEDGCDFLRSSSYSRGSRPTPHASTRPGLKQSTLRWAEPAQLATPLIHTTVEGSAFGHTAEFWVHSGLNTPRGANFWGVSPHRYATAGLTKPGVSSSLLSRSGVAISGFINWVFGVSSRPHVQPYMLVVNPQVANEHGYFFPQSWSILRHKFQSKATPLRVTRFTPTVTSPRSLAALWANNLAPIQSRYSQTSYNSQATGGRFGSVLSIRAEAASGLNLSVRKARYSRVAGRHLGAPSVFLSKGARLRRLVTTELGGVRRIERHSTSTWGGLSSAVFQTQRGGKGSASGQLFRSQSAQFFYPGVSSLAGGLRAHLYRLQSTRLDFDFRILSGRFKQPCVRYRPGFFTYWRQYRWQLRQQLSLCGGFRQHTLSRYVSRTRRVSTFSFFHLFSFTPRCVYQQSHLSSFGSQGLFFKKKEAESGLAFFYLVNGAPSRGSFNQLYVGDVIFFFICTNPQPGFSGDTAASSQVWGANYLPAAGLVDPTQQLDTPYYLEVDELSQSVVILIQPLGSNEVNRFGGVGHLAHASYKLYNWKYLT